jgi:DnaJ homolog subfamily C member 27
MAAAADAPPATRLKIISVGDSQTGKSCLIKRFCENKFVVKYVPTIGVDYGVRPTTVTNPRGGGTTPNVKINFFDLSGFPAYADIRTEFYKDAHGAALVFAVDNRESFEKLDSWLKEARDNSVGANCAWVLIGNKTDAKRTVAPEEAKAWAADHGMPYFDVSASTGQDVNAAFEALFVKALEPSQAAAASGK